MGRAQVVQAEAAAVGLGCHMNPVLLKPIRPAVSKVVFGQFCRVMDAVEIP